GNARTCALGRIHDLLRRLVQDAVIERAQANPHLILTSQSSHTLSFLLACVSLCRSEAYSSQRKGPVAVRFADDRPLGVCLFHNLGDHAGPDRVPPLSYRKPQPLL